MPLINLFFLMVISIITNFSIASASEDIEVLKKSIETTTDKIEVGIIHRKIGDYYTSQGDYKKAADEYIKALSLARGKFTLGERTQLAIYLSWGGKLSEAIEELRLILSEEPANLRARIHLARVLSWSGNLDEAIGEAEHILKEFPDNKEVLLVKASALRWKGNFKTAIPIYEKILEKEDDFDARLGLSYAYLSAGNFKAARESRKLLKAGYSYQEKELNEFILTMDKAARPDIDSGYSYYKDSDDNIVNRYSLGFGFWTGNWKNYVGYSHADAEDNIRDARAEDLSFRTYSKLTESLGIGGGFGFNQTSNDETANFLTGHIKADINILSGTAGVSIAREVFTATAQLIENGIRITNANFYISQKLTSKLSLYGNYSYRDFSDDNSANDFHISPSYLIYTNPTVNLGYRFRYLDFNRQSNGGYFDPDDFISHQIFVSLYFAKGIFYGTLEPYGGYQSFERYGEKTDDFFSGGYGSLGVKLTEKSSLEVNAEGGNYALGTAAGWNYYIVGFRFILNI